VLVLLLFLRSKLSSLPVGSWCRDSVYVMRMSPARESSIPVHISRSVCHQEDTIHARFSFVASARRLRSTRQIFFRGFSSSLTLTRLASDRVICSFVSCGFSDLLKVLQVEVAGSSFIVLVVFLFL
jgi:hypothetical protein